MVGKNTNSMLEAARVYQKRGWIIHPVRAWNDLSVDEKARGKAPLLNGWQNREEPLSDEELERWFKNSDYNIGLQAGKRSNVTVIDYDHDLFMSKLLAGISLHTLQSSRAEGRGHIYFQYTPEFKSQKYHILGIEILNDGSNVILPPSRHREGGFYQWRDPTAPLSSMPEELKQRLRELFEAYKRLITAMAEVRPCFKRLWNDGNPQQLHSGEGREAMAAWMLELRAHGCDLTAIKTLAVIVYKKDYDSEKTTTEWQNWKGGPWTCKKIRERLSSIISCKNCSRLEVREQLKVSKLQEQEQEQEIELKYGDTDFGRLVISPNLRGGFIVSVKSNEFPISERDVPADFYRREWYQNIIFKHIKRNLSEKAYEDFLGSIVQKLISVVGTPQKTESSDIRYQTKGFLSDGRYYEEILRDGIEQFVVYDTERDEWTYETQIKEGETTILPLPISEHQRDSIILPDGVEEYGNLKSLRERMIAFAEEQFDPVDNRELFELAVYLELCSWIAAEWMVGLPERFIPILAIRGPSETGKKRFLTVARWLSYRSLYALKTTKVPTLFRAISQWGGTLILDEADLYDSSESNEFIEFMNSRADGVPIARYDSSKQAVVFFHSFGLSVIAERSAARDDGYESRKIIFPSEATTNIGKYSLIPPSEWIEKGRQLQRNLLLFRLRHLKGVIPSNLLIQDITGFRVRESLLMLQALKEEDGEIIANLKRLAQVLQRRLIEERSGSIEGLIMNVVYNRILDDNSWIEIFQNNVEIRMQYGQGEDVYSVPLTLKSISKALGEQLTPSDVARRWRGLGQSVRARGRVDGKLHAGIIQIKNPSRFLKEVGKYVVDVDYEELEGKLQVQKKLLG